MRKFLNTLYVLNKDAYLSLEGENIVLLCNKTEIGRVPLHRLEGIVCFSYPGASPALMGKCARLGVDLSFFSPQGRFLARGRRRRAGQRPAAADPVPHRRQRGRELSLCAQFHPGQSL